MKYTKQSLIDCTAHGSIHVGKELGVPVYQLLPGGKQRDWVPLSWWCHSNSPEDWVREAEYALAAGYTTCKYKARPWWDIVEQVEAVNLFAGSGFIQTPLSLFSTENH